MNIFSGCPCPLNFIFNCPCTACLAPHFTQQQNVFAFFACGRDESLPLSTDAPMDLFSSCLLMPYDTAIWWHMQRHSSVYEEPQMPSDSNKPSWESCWPQSWMQSPLKPSVLTFISRLPLTPRWPHFSVVLSLPSG
jgi:hypothetical protein